LYKYFVIFADLILPTAPIGGYAKDIYSIAFFIENIIFLKSSVNSLDRILLLTIKPRFSFYI